MGYRKVPTERRAKGFDIARARIAEGREPARSSLLESAAGDFDEAVLIDNGARTVALVVVAR